jgi:hypothetical protein
VKKKKLYMNLLDYFFRYWRNEECPGKLKSEEISRLENAPKVTGNNWKLAWILPYLLPQVFFNFILPAGFPGNSFTYPQRSVVVFSQSSEEDDDDGIVKLHLCVEDDGL